MQKSLELKVMDMEVLVREVYKETMSHIKNEEDLNFDVINDRYLEAMEKFLKIAKDTWWEIPNY